MNIVESVADNIKKIKIQGATNVALSSLEAINEYAKKADISDIRKGIDTLLSTRPTEPLMINSLGALKKITDPFEVSERAWELRAAIKGAMGKITEIGSRLIEDGMIVQTICHSSTVINILKETREQGKKIKVVNTETRPLYQGRKTAEELYKAGLNVTMYADSAIYKGMKDEKVDIVLAGIDAIFVDGGVANKIGTGLLALSASALEVPFYACGLALKLDLDSIMAKSVKIEERDPREIWGYPINVKNPAFEKVPGRRIKGIITELGVLPPATAHMQITKEYEL